MADSINKIGNIEFHNHNVLDVVTNGNGQFLVVRANNNEPITDTEYYMALAKGRDGKDGRDGRDGKDGKDGVAGAVPTIEISSDGYWIVNGQKTSNKIPEPKVPKLDTTVISSNQDLNDLRENGSYFGDYLKVVNSPFSDSSTHTFILTVKAYDGSQTVQEIVDLTSADKWIRTYNGSSWTSWRAITQWD